MAVLTPWLFLKEPFDLLATTSDIQQLTDVGKSTVEQRQALAQKLISILPWFSLGSMVLGVFCGAFGLYRWFENQKILDEKIRVELEISKNSLRDATPDEIDSTRDAEAEESLEQAQKASSAADDLPRRTVVAAEARRLEYDFVARVTEAFNQDFEILTEKMVSDVFVDIALRGKRQFSKDYLIELKYIKRGFNFGWLREVALKVRHLATLYAQTQGRIPNTILVIAAEPHVWKNDKYQSYIERLKQEMPRGIGKNRVVYLSTDEIPEMQPAQLRQRLGVAA